jgi:hypothetical protein
MLTALPDVKYECLRMLDGLVSTHHKKILYEKCKDQKFQVKLPENETLIKIGLFWNVDLTGKRGCTFEVKDGLATFQLSHKIWLVAVAQWYVHRHVRKID